MAAKQRYGVGCQTSRWLVWQPTATMGPSCHYSMYASTETMGMPGGASSSSSCCCCCCRLRRKHGERRLWRLLSGECSTCCCWELPVRLRTICLSTSAWSCTSCCCSLKTIMLCSWDSRCIALLTSAIRSCRLVYPALVRCTQGAYTYSEIGDSIVTMFTAG